MRIPRREDADLGFALGHERAVEEPDARMASAGVRQHFKRGIRGALGQAFSGDVPVVEILPHLCQGQASGGAYFVRCVAVVGNHVVEPAPEFTVAPGRAGLGGGRVARGQTLVVREGGVVFGHGLH